MSIAEHALASGAHVVVEGVRRVHQGAIVAVDDVSLELEAGEFVVLTGPSGSGKTSLLSLIGVLDRPTAGRVLIDGEPIADGSDARARYHREVVGFVFQHHHLLGHLPARANVELPLVGAGLGLILGVFGADALGRGLGVSQVVTPEVTPWTMGQALLIGVLIGVLGGLYPAWRGTSVSTTELLGGA